MIYKNFIKPILFKLDAERAHELGSVALRGLDNSVGRALVQSVLGVKSSRLRCSYFGKTFESPIGLAAGFDKNCELVRVLPSFGFGFVECGTVTALAQAGNSKPRLFRLPKDQALINRLGFNNCGAADAAQNLTRLTQKPLPCVLGVNIGKSKVTELENATQDYLRSFSALWKFADYVTINVSSPNTPGLRSLQHNLDPLLSVLQDKNKEIAAQNNNAQKPIFVKIAPDLEGKEWQQIVESALRFNVQGLIVSNTTISRDAVHLDLPIEGGLSGAPLRQKSTEMLGQIYRASGGKLMLIGVGGIFSAQDVYDKICAGASLVQVYTGWIYNGPAFVRDLNRGLIQLLKRDGFSNVQQAVGYKNK